MRLIDAIGERKRGVRRIDQALQYRADIRRRAVRTQIERDFQATASRDQHAVWWSSIARDLGSHVLDVLAIDIGRILDAHHDSILFGERNCRQLHWSS